MQRLWYVCIIMLVGNQHVMLLTVRRSGVMGGDATMHLGRRGLKTYSSMHQKGFTFCSKRELHFRSWNKTRSQWLTDKQTQSIECELQSLTRMHAEKIWNLAKYRCFFPLAVQGRGFWNEQRKGTRVCWKAVRHKSKHNRRIFLQGAPRSDTSTEGEEEEEEEGVRRCFVVLVHDRS